MELNNSFRVSVPVSEAWTLLTDVERIAPCLPGAQLQEIEGDRYRGIVKIKVGPITAQYAGTASFLELDAGAHRAVLRAEGRDTRGQGNANATVTATLTAAGPDATEVEIVTDLTVTGKVAQFGRGVLAEVSAKLIGQFVDNLERDVLSGAAAPSASVSLEAARSTVVSKAVPSSPSSPEAKRATVVSKAVSARASDASRTTLRSTAAAPPPPPPSLDSAPAAPAPAVSLVEPSPPKPTVRRVDMPEPEPVDLLAAAGSPIAQRVLPVAGLGLFVVLLLWRRRRRRARRGRRASRRLR